MATGATPAGTANVVWFEGRVRTAEEMGHPAMLIMGRTAAAPRPGIGVLAGNAMAARGRTARAMIEESIVQQGQRNEVSGGVANY